MTMSESANSIDKGMAAVVAAETNLSDVRGEIGELIYCGYNINDLAEKATFEEVVHLLLGQVAEGLLERRERAGAIV